MAPKKYCAGSVKDGATGWIRPCRRTVARRHTFCHGHRKQSISTSNPHVATEHTPAVTPPHTPPATPLHTLPATPLHTLPATPLHTLPETPLASGKTSLREIDTSI